MEELHEEETLVAKPNVFLMVTNPVENFKRIRKHPTWLVPLIIIALITSITAVLILKMTFDGDYLGSEFGIMFEGDEEFAAQFASGMFYFSAATAVISSFVVLPIVCLFMALIYLLVGKISNSPASFKQYFSLSIFVTIIGALGGVANLIYNKFVPGVGPDFVFTSLQALLKADGALAIAFAAINVFAIWQLVITAIGLQVVGKYSKGLAWATVIVIFLISTGLGVGSFLLNEFVTPTM